jgi:TIR domain
VKIFISYRRDDARHFAERLYDRLVRRFGSDFVFKDVDFLVPGGDFPSQLEKALSQCDVCLAVIGKHWTGSKSWGGRRRIDHPKDFVRFEIETALRRGMRVVPVLADEAAMPKVNDLPAGLRPLAFQEAQSIGHDPDFHRDIDRLLIHLGEDARVPSGEYSDVDVYGTRQEWWGKELLKVLATCEKFVLIDSYQGEKHGLWSSLEQRILDPRPFELIVACLGADDPFLKMCFGVSRSGQVDKRTMDTDREAARKLIGLLNGNPWASNKSVRFLVWHGVSPGPVVAWTKNAREIIALGMWQQITGSTDLSPWLVVYDGPIYRSLKLHYQRVIDSADSMDV